MNTGVGGAAGNGSDRTGGHQRHDRCPRDGMTCAPRTTARDPKIKRISTKSKGLALKLCTDDHNRVGELTIGDHYPKQIQTPGIADLVQEHGFSPKKNQSRSMSSCGFR